MAIGTEKAVVYWNWNYYTRLLHAPILLRWPELQDNNIGRQLQKSETKTKLLPGVANYALAVIDSIWVSLEHAKLRREEGVFRQANLGTFK